MNFTCFHFLSCRFSSRATLLSILPSTVSPSQVFPIFLHISFKLLLFFGIWYDLNNSYHGISSFFVELCEINPLMITNISMLFNSKAPPFCLLAKISNDRYNGFKWTKKIQFGHFLARWYIYVMRFKLENRPNYNCNNKKIFGQMYGFLLLCNAIFIPQVAFYCIFRYINFQT